MKFLGRGRHIEPGNVFWSKMDTTTLPIFGQKESRLIQCTSKFVKFSLKLGDGGERSPDSVRGVNFVKKQRSKVIFREQDNLRSTSFWKKETEIIKKSKTKNWKIPFERLKSKIRKQRRNKQKLTKRGTSRIFDKTFLIE